MRTLKFTFFIVLFVFSHLANAQESDNSQPLTNSQNSRAIKLNKNQIVELVKSGRYNEAIQLFESLDTDIQETFTGIHLIEAYHNRGKTFSEKKQNPRALKDFNKAIKLATESIDITPTLIARAYVYRQLKAYESSIKDYSAVLKVSPDDVEALLGRGLSYLKHRKPNEGMADLNKAIKLKADYAMAYYHRGQAWFALGKFPEAAADFRMTTIIDPEYAWAYYYHGFALENSGKTYEAKKAYNRFIERAPDSYSQHIAAARKRIRLLR